MRGLRTKLKRSWGVRHSLGLGIILASLVLSFMLVSCGNDEATVANAGGNKLNAPAQQAANTPAGSPVVPTTAAPQQVQVVVAARAVEAGTILELGDVSIQFVARSQYNPDTDITDPQQVINRINLVPYNTGQQIKKGDLVEGSFSAYMRQLVAQKRLEPGKKAFAYATNDLATVAGLIQENDLVDVVATYIVERRVPVPAGSQVQSGGINVAPNTGLELTTKTVLQNVRVLKVIHLQARAGAQPPPVPTATPAAVNPDTPSPVVAVQPTATPTPTLQPYSEAGLGFQVNTILILGVTDQEAEVLKFTREYRLSATSGRLNITNPIVNVGDTNYSAFNDVATTTGGVSVVHFVLRPRPQDPANPVDPAVALERTTGVTFRILIRDYGLQIPELVFASNTTT